MTTFTANCDQMVAQELLGRQGILKQFFRQLFETLVLKSSINRERQQLLEMSDSMLSDIGITRAQAQEEARRTELPEARLNAQAMGKC